MGEPVELSPHGFDDAGVAMPGIHHADAAAEIDQPVAVGVGDDGALGVHDGDRRDGGHALRHRPRAAGEKRATVGTGDLGLEMNDAGHAEPLRSGWLPVEVRSVEALRHPRVIL